MMTNFRTVMISDANAAMTMEEHNASLVAFYAIFGDVMDTDFVIQRLTRNDCVSGGMGGDSGSLGETEKQARI